MVNEILDKFQYIISKKLPNELPPMTSIQHAIDLILGSQLPNLFHYCMNYLEHVELNMQIERLLEKGFIRESKSPYIISTLLVPKKDNS